jgi:HSP20 family protein
MPMNLQKWSPFGTARWDPFREMADMQERMERMFELSPLRSETGRGLLSARDWAPLVDVSEDEREYLVEAELPEVKKDDVKVSVENGVLHLSGERKHEEETRTKKQHRIERSYGRFARSFTLPDDVDAAKVSAEFKDGLLKVHVLKSERAKPKTTEVKVS